MRQLDAHTRRCHGVWLVDENIKRAHFLAECSFLSHGKCVAKQGNAAGNAVYDGLAVAVIVHTNELEATCPPDLHSVCVSRRICECRSVRRRERLIRDSNADVDPHISKDQLCDLLDALDRDSKPRPVRQIDPSLKFDAIDGVVVKFRRQVAVASNSHAGRGGCCALDVVSGGQAPPSTAAAAWAVGSADVRLPVGACVCADALLAMVRTEVDGGCIEWDVVRRSLEHGENEHGNVERVHDAVAQIGPIASRSKWRSVGRVKIAREDPVIEVLCVCRPTRCFVQ